MKFRRVAEQIAERFRQVPVQMADEVPEGSGAGQARFVESSMA